MGVARIRMNLHVFLAQAAMLLVGPCATLFLRCLPQSLAYDSAGYSPSASFLLSGSFSE